MKLEKNNFVKFKGRLGIVIDSKKISVPDPMKDYWLYKIAFGEDTPTEWINEMYLVKV